MLIEYLQQELPKKEKPLTGEELSSLLPRLVQLGGITLKIRTDWQRILASALSVSIWGKDHEQKSHAAHIIAFFLQDNTVVGRINKDPELKKLFQRHIVEKILRRNWALLSSALVESRLKAWDGNAVEIMSEGELMFIRKSFEESLDPTKVGKHTFAAYHLLEWEKQQEKSSMDSLLTRKMNAKAFKKWEKDISQLLETAQGAIT